MRASGSSAFLILGALLAGVEVAACTLDLAGMPGPASTASTNGAGGMATSSATGTGGSGASTGSAPGTGGSGGSAPVCGNGTLEAGEACDDSNTALGDGCSPACTVEPLDTCPGLPIPLAPPGLTLAGTLVGAHDELKPSCGPNGADVIYEVTPTVSGTLKITLTGAYDKSVSVRSSCLDSKTAEISCDAGQGALVERRWVYANVKYYVVVDAGAEAFSLRLDLTTCGDGTQQELEECDDPNDTNCIGCFKCSGNGQVFDPESRHCYQRIPGQAKDWKSARGNCLAWGGDLVGISSAAEAEFLKSKFNDVWSGANDLANECSFEWVNGEPWQPRWANNEPNDFTNDEDCAVFYDSGQMNDTDCDDHRDALCERAPGGSCGDGILQPGEECDDKIAYAHLTCTKCVIQCPAGEIEDPATRHCYLRVPAASFDWSAAQSGCAAAGAYLATINSPAENALLQASLPGPMWIGASRPYSTADFEWLNTDALCYANWEGQPSGDIGKNCALIQANGTWSNDDCKQKKGYICERDN